MREWRVRLAGGCYDGWKGATFQPPQPVLVAWVCGRGFARHATCEGHATFDPGDPLIRLESAVAYRLAEMDPLSRSAVYKVGDGDLTGEAQATYRQPLTAI